MGHQDSLRKTVNDCFHYYVCLAVYHYKELKVPYIAPEKRGKLDPTQKNSPKDAGELNYVLTKICRGYAGKDYNYGRLNEIMGALECAKLEFYRRLAVPYEDKKIAENGDLI